jgi:hypothetical protein
VALPANRVKKEPLEMLDPKVQQAMQAIEDYKAFREMQVLEGIPDLPVQVKWDHRDLKEMRDQLGRQEKQDHKAFKENRVHRVHFVQPDLWGRV